MDPEINASLASELMPKQRREGVKGSRFAAEGRGDNECKDEFFTEALPT